MTEAEQQLVRETVAGLRVRGKEVTCPHCSKQIHLGVQLFVKPFPEDDHVQQDVAPPHPPAYSAKEAELLDTAKRCGLFDAFSHAAREERAFAGVPGDMDGFFLLFWRTIGRVEVPRIALAAWIAEFDGRIEVFGSNGVLAIVSDGDIKAFIPNRYVRRSLTDKGPQIPATVQFEQWVKSKFGYVPVGAGHFASALRQSNIGGFGRLVQ